MFQFFFQSGEFVGIDDGWLKDALLFVGEAIAQFFVIIMGARIAAKNALEQYKNQKKDQEKDQSDKQKNFYLEKLEYFEHVVSNSEKFGKDLLDNVNKVLKNTNPAIPQVGDLSMVAWDDLKRSVFEVDREIIYHAWASEKVGGDIKVLFSDLDTLNRVRRQFVGTYRHRLKGVGALRKELSILIQEINKTILTFSSEDIGLENEGFLLTIKRIWFDFNTKTKLQIRNNHFTFNVYDIKNSLLDPAQRTFSPFFGKKAFLPLKAGVLHSLFLKTGVCINNIVETMELYQKELEGIDKNLAEGLKRIKPTAEFLRKHLDVTHPAPPSDDAE